MLFKIIFFDGVCNLCNSSVNFIIDHDSKKQFRFVSLQSSFAKELISNPENNFKLFTTSGLLPLNEDLRNELNSLNSFLYLEDGIFYSKSTAALLIAKQLDGIIKYIYFTKFIPTILRDKIYEYIAHNRYKWFGKQNSCRMPTPELRDLFLE